MFNSKSHLNVNASIDFDWIRLAAFEVVAQQIHDANSMNYSKFDSFSQNWKKKKCYVYSTNSWQIRFLLNGLTRRWKNCVVYSNKVVVIAENSAQIRPPSINFEAKLKQRLHLFGRIRRNFKAFGSTPIITDWFSLLATKYEIKLDDFATIRENEAVICLPSTNSVWSGEGLPTTFTDSGIDFKQNWLIFVWCLRV